MSLTGTLEPEYTLEGNVHKVIPNEIDTSLTVEGAAADAKAAGDAIAAAKKDAAAELKAHAENSDNPHKVTKKQLGLDSVDNTSDQDKPVSRAQAEAIAVAKKAGTDAMTAAQNAQKAAEEAMTQAQGAGQTAEQNAKVYADGLHKVFAASLSADGWVGEAAPYTQEVSVEGILSSDNPHIAPAFSGVIKTAIDEKNAWERVSYAVSGEGVITFTCLEERPGTDINIQIEVNR